MKTSLRQQENDLIYRQGQKADNTGVKWEVLYIYIYNPHIHCC